jgi:hypothetical protein
MKENIGLFQKCEVPRVPNFHVRGTSMHLILQTGYKTVLLTVSVRVIVVQCRINITGTPHRNIFS